MKLATLAAAAAAALFTASGLAHAAGTVLIVTHEVKDFAAWKTGYDSDKANREKAGLVQRYVLRGADNPNVVTVVFEAASADKARAFASSPALKDAMSKAGVVSAPVITIANEVK